MIEETSAFNRGKKGGFYLGKSSSCLLHLLPRTENNSEWSEQYQHDDEVSKKLFALTILHKRHIVPSCRDKIAIAQQTFVQD